MKSTKLIFFSLLFLFAQFANAQVAELSKIEKYIKKKLPNATVKKLEAKDHFKEVYEIKFKQYLDHNNPKAGTFEHRIFLSHVDKKKQMLYVTEGYAGRQRTYELSKILNSNVKWLTANVYRINELNLGKFDLILFLGVIYHLRNPYLAIDNP